MELLQIIIQGAWQFLNLSYNLGGYNIKLWYPSAFVLIFGVFYSLATNQIFRLAPSSSKVQKGYSQKSYNHNSNANQQVIVYKFEKE